MSKIESVDITKATKKLLNLTLFSRLIYTKEFNSRKEARVHEIYLKSGIGKEKLREIRNIIGDEGLSTDR